jgi:hypothetical protein
MALAALAILVCAPGRAVSASVEPITVGGITVSAGPVEGKEAISVEGKAPALAPVTLTLVATISRDLPNVYLNRREILTDASGHFSAIVPIAADFWRGSIVTVTASSPDTTTTATAHVKVIAPNAGVWLPADDVPNH